MRDTALRAPDLEEAHSSCSDRYPPMPSAGEAEDSEDASTLPSSSIATVCLDATSTDAKHADAKADRFCQHPLPFPLALREARARAAATAAEDAYSRGDVEAFIRWYSEDAHRRRQMNEQFERAQRNVVTSVSGDSEVVQFSRDHADAAGRKFHAHGVECWEFDEDGRLRRREASVNGRSWGARAGQSADDRAELSAFC